MESSSLRGIKPCSVSSFKTADRSKFGPFDDDGLVVKRQFMTYTKGPEQQFLLKRKL